MPVFGDRIPRTRHNQQGNQMKTLFKWLIRAVLTIVVLLGLLIAYVVLFLDPNEYKQTISEQVQEATGLDLRIEGEITWSFWPSVAIQLEDVQVANPEGFSEYSLLEAGVISSSVQLLPLITGQVSIDHITISDAMVNLVTSRSGDSNIEAILGQSESAGETADTDLAPGGELRAGEVSFSNVQLNMIDQMSGTVRVMMLDEARLDSFIPGAESRLSLSGMVSDSNLPRLESVGIANILSEADAMLERIELVGMLTVGGSDGLVSLSQLELDTRLVGFKSDITLSADLVYNSNQGERLLLDNATLGINQETYVLSVDLPRHGALTAEFSLDGQSMNLDALIDSVSSFASSVDSDEIQSVADNQAPDWTDFVDIGGRIRIDRLTYAGMTIGNIEAAVTKRSSTLGATIVRAESFGGEISVELGADMDTVPAEIRVSADFAQIDMAQLTEHVAGSPMINSLGDVSLQLTGQGLDPGGLLRTLGGAGDYEFTAGALLGVDLTRLVEELIAQESLVGVTGVFEGETAFEAMSGTIAIDKGVVTIPDFRMVSDSFNVTGNGSLDLNAGTVDYSMQVRLLGTLEDLFLERYGDYSEAVLPIAISGDMAVPSIGFDLEEFLALNAKARIDKEKDEIKDKLRGKLFDSLLGGDDDEEDGNQ